MRISYAEVDNYGAVLVVAIVPSEFTQAALGPGMIVKIQRRLPTKPIMLVSIEANGTRAYADFETHVLLALIQLETLHLTVLDLDSPLPEQELPF